MNIEEIKEILAYVLSLTYGNDNALKGVNQIQDYITNLEQEIDRLNNIINELERWLKEDLKNNYRDAGYRHNLIIEVLDKLKELKDSE